MTVVLVARILGEVVDCVIRLQWMRYDLFDDGIDCAVVSSIKIVAASASMTLAGRMPDAAVTYVAVFNHVDGHRRPIAGWQSKGFA